MCKYRYFLFYHKINILGGKTDIGQVNTKKKFRVDKC